MMNKLSETFKQILSHYIEAGSDRWKSANETLYSYEKTPSR